jgi:hypothetical protein
VITQLQLINIIIILPDATRPWGRLNLLQPSGPVIDLYGDCLTFTAKSLWRNRVTATTNHRQAHGVGCRSKQLQIPKLWYNACNIMGTAVVHAEVQIWGEMSASRPGRFNSEVQSLLPWICPRIDVDPLQKTKTSCSCLAFIRYPLFTVGAADYLLFKEFLELRYSNRHTPSHTTATPLHKPHGT